MNLVSLASSYLVTRLFGTWNSLRAGMSFPSNPFNTFIHWMYFKWSERKDVRLAADLKHNHRKNRDVHGRIRRNVSQFVSLLLLLDFLSNHNRIRIEQGVLKKARTERSLPAFATLSGWSKHRETKRADRKRTAKSRTWWIWSTTKSIHQLHLEKTNREIVVDEGCVDLGEESGWEK